MNWILGPWSLGPGQTGPIIEFCCKEFNKRTIVLSTGSWDPGPSQLGLKLNSVVKSLVIECFSGELDPGTLESGPWPDWAKS